MPNKQKKLYIVAKEPLLDETKRNLQTALSESKNKRVLCFDSSLNSNNIEKLTHKYKSLLLTLTGKELEVVMFNETSIEDTVKKINDCNIFYFKRVGLLEYYREFLRKNGIPEDEHSLVGQKAYAPTTFVVKYNHRYVKLFNLNRGDDDSFYVNFDGNYEVDSSDRRTSITSPTIELAKTSNGVNNPHISLHPNSGVIHCKGNLGERFIPDLKTTCTKRIVDTAGLSPFCAIVSSPNYIALPDIGTPPTKTGLFNLIEVCGETPNIVKNGLKAPTFIVLDSALLEGNQTFTIELWVHKKIPGADVVGSLTNLQKRNLISHITVDNALSPLSYTALIKYAESTVNTLEYALILQIFNDEEYVACKIRRIE